MGLDQRKLRVLQSVVEAYIANAQPVGSRTIARDFDLNVSPATIRNEMADLENMGYLEQPHTSAGRIPSDLGYRMYVDQIARIAQPSRDEIEVIQKVIGHRVSEMESLFYTASRLLSEMTDCLSLLAGPFTGRSVLSAVEIVPLRRGRAMVLVVTEDGFVQNQIVDSPGIEPEQMEHASEIFNQYLRGHTVHEILHGSLLEELRHELNLTQELMDTAMALLLSQKTSEQHPDFFLEGAANIMKHPEFHDIHRTQRVLSALSRRSVIWDLLRRFPKEDIFALIGAENVYEDIQECSVVSAVYYVGGKAAGRIGVIGPRRMNYSRIMGIVKAMTEVVSDSLSDGQA